MKDEELKRERDKIQHDLNRLAAAASDGRMCIVECLKKGTKERVYVLSEVGEDGIGPIALMFGSSDPTVEYEPCERDKDDQSQIEKLRMLYENAEKTKIVDQLGGDGVKWGEV